MAITAFSHFAVRVQDIERALHFYRDLLGFRLIQERMEPLGPPPADGSPQPLRRALYLRWADPPAPFLVIEKREATVSPAERSSVRAGVDHYAWWVDDLNALCERLEGAGVPVVLRRRQYTIDWYAEPPGGNAVTALFQDPDGNILQFDQRL